MDAQRYPVFGQELYFDDSIKVIENFDVGESDLVNKIADTLPQPSPVTRKRVATKIVQRFYKSAAGEPSAFIQFIRSLKNESDRRDLIYWRTARTDRIISSIACEIFYPYFVLDTLPAGFDEHTFRAANTGRLFDVDKIITSDFVVRYARDAWKFRVPRVISLSLRILNQSNILDSIHIKVGHRNVLGYFPHQHAISPEVFAFCLAEEILSDELPSICSVNNAESCKIAKLFLLNRLRVKSLLKDLQRMKIIEQINIHGKKHFRYLTTDLSSLLESLKKT